jgi:predicted DNA-binding protein with PD1-like motif
MEYRKYGSAVYIRMDRGDEIIEGILDICRKEHILSADFSGIGGCGEAEVQTYMPETKTFETRKVSGMLELVSLTGNITAGEGDEPRQHSHALFAYKDGEEHCVVAGHIKSITVLLTAEIVLRPVEAGIISRKADEKAGIDVWSFR